MKHKIIMLFALISPLAAENLFSNGGMDTAGGWKGNRKIEEEKVGDKPNRFMQISAKKKDTVSFHQEVDTKGMLSLELKFRYRTKDYKGRGLELRGQRAGGGFTFTNYKVVADGEWHEIHWSFNQVQGSRNMDFHFIVLEGEGDVCFDDISAEKS
jgi:hypothetical protein